ncbi:MAG: Rpn family recombination-promoting nuclease/putative transposase [Oscillospiraceae bacterium]|nr:Rpn family recombination-promoting nuclease/putative transposase [Oscillospiraceae bacterium]
MIEEVVDFSYIYENDDKEIDIEIQLSYMATWADRSVFYVSKMLVEQVDINKYYSNIKKCNVSTDVMEWHLIELPKLPKETDGTLLDKWTRFINAERREQFEMIVQRNKYLQSAFETLNTISQANRNDWNILLEKQLYITKMNMLLKIMNVAKIK